MNNRRELIGWMTAMASLPLLPALSAEPHPEIAFTFDDPKTAQLAGMNWKEINEHILATLAKRKLQAMLFVCGMRVDSEEGRALVTAWDRRGHLIGNHSYSHRNIDDTSLEQFAADVLKNEPLIASYRHFTRSFRFPFFKEGNTAEKRDGMRVFLAAHRYRIGRATVDASDWAISARLEKRAKDDPAADFTGYRDFFLEHIWQRAQFYQGLAQRLLSQPVRHTVLLHHSPLNALFLDDLIAMFVERGWRPVDAAYAYRDPIYERQPQCLPAGESLLWALAKESRRFDSELRYPGEDDVYENPRMDALKL
jgi:peptidoglycan/xylan/chitin deacetylase (PgdA/CDA1 family)